MNRILQTTVLFLLIAVMGIETATAQSNAEKEIERRLEFRLLMQKLENTLSEVPFNVQRVVFLKLEHNPVRFDDDRISYVRDEIESVFSSQPGITMLHVPELEMSPVLEISSSDTSLVVKNLSPFSASSSPDELLKISEKYAIQGFLDGRIQYNPALGYQLNLRITRAESREVVWNKTIETRTFEPEPEKFEGKRTIIAAGAGMHSTQNYQMGGSVYGGDFLTLNYSAALTFRQSMTPRNSGYVGLTGTINFISLTNIDEDGSFEEFSKMVPGLGISFYKTFIERSDIPNDHWIEAYVGVNMLFPPGNDNKFSVTQGVYLNLTDNLGISIDLNYILGEDPSLVDEETENRLNLNNLGYGLRFLLRF